MNTTKKAAITPREWEWREGIGGRSLYVVNLAKPETRIADICWPGTDEGRANARLIAAAPKLLGTAKAALVDLKENLEAIGGCDHSVGICCCEIVRNLEDLQDAIAEAEGK